MFAEWPDSGRRKGFGRILVMFSVASKFRADFRDLSSHGGNPDKES